jgi:hypothetical protein
MRGSSEPATAIHAAAGEIPRQKPSTRCDNMVKALGVGVEKQDRQRHGRKLERQAIELPRGEHQHATLADGEAQAKPIESAPVAARDWRCADWRGRSRTSAMRFMVMAAERAPTIAITIQKNLPRRRPAGLGPAKRAASSAPVSANGGM